MSRMVNVEGTAIEMAASKAQERSGTETASPMLSAPELTLSVLAFETGGGMGGRRQGREGKKEEEREKVVKFGREEEEHERERNEGERRRGDAKGIGGTRTFDH